MSNINQTLYEQNFEHDACGIGAVVSIDGIPDYKVLDEALQIVEKLNTGPEKMPAAKSAMASVF